MAFDYTAVSSFMYVLYVCVIMFRHKSTKQTTISNKCTDRHIKITNYNIVFVADELFKDLLIPDCYLHCCCHIEYTLK